MKLHCFNQFQKRNYIFQQGVPQLPSNPAKISEEKSLKAVEEVIEGTGAERFQLQNELNKSMKDISPEFTKFQNILNQLKGMDFHEQQPVTKNLNVFGTTITVVVEKSGNDLVNSEYLNFTDLSNRGTEIKNLLTWMKENKK